MSEQQPTILVAVESYGSTLIKDSICVLEKKDREVYRVRLPNGYVGGWYPRRFRAATPEEVEAFNNGIRDIKQMQGYKPVPVEQRMIMVVNVGMGRSTVYANTVRKAQRIPLASFLTKPDPFVCGMYHAGSIYRPDTYPPADIVHDLFVVTMQKWRTESRRGLLECTLIKENHSEYREAFDMLGFQLVSEYRNPNSLNDLEVYHYLHGKDKTETEKLETLYNKVIAENKYLIVNE